MFWTYPIQCSDNNDKDNDEAMLMKKRMCQSRFVCWKTLGLTAVRWTASL